MGATWHCSFDSSYACIVSSVIFGSCCRQSVCFKIVKFFSCNSFVENKTRRRKWCHNVLRPCGKCMNWAIRSSSPGSSIDCCSNTSVHFTTHPANQGLRLLRASIIHLLDGSDSRVCIWSLQNNKVPVTKSSLLLCQKSLFRRKIASVTLSWHSVAQCYAGAAGPQRSYGFDFSVCSGLVP